MATRNMSLWIVLLAILFLGHDGRWRAESLAPLVLTAAAAGLVMWLLRACFDARSRLARWILGESAGAAGRVFMEGTEGHVGGHHQPARPGRARCR